MTWLDYQRAMKDALLAEGPSHEAWRALGNETARWQAYRRMVRSRFYQTIDHAFERLIGVVGVERFHRVVDRFLAEDPPRSPYLRDLPGEFLRFVEKHPSALAEPEPLPPYALDLMRYEWAELDAAYSHEEVRADDVVALDMQRPAVLSPAHRLLRLEHRVHAIGTDGAGAPAERALVHLLLYRDRHTHEVETLELTPVAATMLATISRLDPRVPPLPLVDVVRQASSAHGAAVDVAFVEALSALLADLTERGVLLGSLARNEGDPR
jgi:hypothetical protein